MLYVKLFWMLRTLTERQKEWLYCTIVAVISFAVIYIIFGFSSRMTESFHGFTHSASIYQIWNGIFPPTNPVSIGMPTSQYWMWYMLLISFMKIFHITSFEAAILSNAIGFSAYMLAMWLGTARYVSSRWIRITLCLIPFYLFQGLLLATALLQFPIGFLRGGYIFRKFLTFQGFGLAQGLFALLLLLVFLRPKSSFRTSLLIATLSCLICFFHPTTSIAVFALAMVGFFYKTYEFFYQKSDADSKYFSTILPFIGMIAGFVVAFPYMLNLRNALAVDIGIHTAHDTSIILLSRLWQLLPAISITIWGAIWWKRISSEIRIMLILACTLAMVSIFASLPGENEYKIIMLSAVPFVLVLSGLIGITLTKIQLAEDKRFFVLLCTTSLALSVLGFTHTVRTFHWYGNDPYIYNGNNIILRVSEPNSKLASRQDAYMWIRNNTPYDSYFLTNPVYKDKAILPTIAQRRIVVSGSWMRGNSHAVPHHDDLMRVSKETIQKLETYSVSDQDLHSLFSVPAPWPSFIYAMAKNPGGVPVHILQNHYEHMPIEVVYTNNEYVIYKLTNIGSTES